MANTSKNKPQVKANNEKEKSQFTKWGDPVLHAPTKKVSSAEIKSPEFQTTLKKMFEMIDGVGVGLAANQIGIGKRFAVVVINPTPNRPNITAVPPTAIINPKILSRSRKMQRGWEGCLSCGGESQPFFYIERAEWINVEYVDGFTGKRVKRKISGFEAVVFQHEIGHLDGNVCGEQVMVRNGKVVPGSIITVDWYRKMKGAPPKSLTK